MNTLICRALTVAVSLCLANAAHAQIISTAMPIEPASSVSPSSGASAKRVSVHVMAGLASWDFDTRDFPEDADLTGGRLGLIAAGDVAVHLPGKLSVGFGGWFNSVQEFVVTQGSDYRSVTEQTVYSVYGNLFFGRVGIQAGVVPFNVRQSFTTVVRFPTRTLVDDHSVVQYDADVFALGRLGSTDADHRRWSAMLGAGVYQFGSHDFYSGPVVIQPDYPRGYAFSGFVTGSANISRRLSVDGSLWYTEHNEQNSRQIRVTVGVGFGL